MALTQWQSLKKRALWFLCMVLATMVCVPSPATAMFGSDGQAKHSKVLLKDVRTLTFYPNKMTTGRRSSPISQMNCIGGNARKAYFPDAIQCTNAGFDGSDVQWKCQADLPTDIKFTYVQVMCEGYAYPDDPYILKGSCGLEYKLGYTHAYKGNSNQYGSESYAAYKRSTWSGFFSSMSLSELTYFCTWLAIAGFIGYKFIKSCLQHQGRLNGDAPPPPYQAPRSNGGGGGGGGGGGRRPWFGGGGAGNDDYYDSGYNKRNGSDYRPGFWSGAGLGALGGYAAAQARNNNRYAGAQANRPAFNRDDYLYQADRYGDYGGNGGGSGSRTTFFGGGSGSGTRSSSSSSNETRTATAFGGTSRR